MEEVREGELQKKIKVQGKFVAEIRDSAKHGATANEAARAYDCAAFDIRGSSAILIFPHEHFPYNVAYNPSQFESMSTKI